MTTSPLAVSPLGDRLKTMLPLLPVAELVYSPAHFPASEARSAESPATVIGVGFDAHAHRTGASAAIQSRAIFTEPSFVESVSTEGWVAVVSPLFDHPARAAGLMPFAATLSDRAHFHQKKNNPAGIAGLFRAKERATQRAA